MEPLAGHVSVLSLVNVGCLFHQLFLLFTALLLPFEICARFVSYILQFVKDAALIKKTVAIDFHQSTATITYEHLQTLLGTYSTLLQTL
jgi:hypothetical protein